MYTISCMTLIVSKVGGLCTELLPLNDLLLYHTQNQKENGLIANCPSKENLIILKWAVWDWNSIVLKMDWS